MEVDFNKAEKSNLDINNNIYKDNNDTKNNNIEYNKENIEISKDNVKDNSNNDQKDYKNKIDSSYSYQFNSSVINNKKNKFNTNKNINEENSINKNNIDNNIDNKGFIINKDDKKNNFRQASINMNNNIINNIEDEDKSNNINRIKSIMILKEIFRYIKDNDFPYKLFFYSKLFQKKFNIRLDYYKNKYEQLNKKKFEILFFDSPLFKEIISEDTIYLLQRNLNDSKFRNNYCNKLSDKLNEANEKYSSFYYIFRNKNGIDDLKNLKIDYNKLRTMAFTEENELNNNENYTYFFQTLFSVVNFKSNLIFLNISFNIYEHSAVESISF